MSLNFQSKIQIWKENLENIYKFAIYLLTYIVFVDIMTPAKTISILRITKSAFVFVWLFWQKYLSLQERISQLYNEMPKTITYTFSNYTDENGDLVQETRKIISERHIPFPRPNAQESVCPTCGQRICETQESCPTAQHYPP